MLVLPNFADFLRHPVYLPISRPPFRL